MPKRLLVLLILILSLLAACSGDGQTPVTEAPAPQEESQPEVAAPTQATAPTEVAAITGPRMECTLVSSQPDAPAELVAIFGVTADDWVKGPDTAAVTFVEYSDFQ